MKKIIMILAWVSGIVGILMSALGSIAVLVGGVLWTHHWANYFYPGGNFILLGIFLFLAVHVDRECCAGKKE